VRFPGSSSAFSLAAPDFVRAPGRSGFSLVELLCTVAIILILYSLYFASGSGHYQARQKALCRQNLEHIYVALKMFAADNNGMFPVATNAATSEAPLSLLVPRYTSVTGIFICPGSKDKKLPEAKPFAQRKISYAYCMGRTINDGANQLLMSDALVDARPKEVGRKIFSADGKKPGNNHNRFGGNLMFCDGQVQSSGPQASVPIAVPAGVSLLNPKP
jgi:prepilin-type N-terminal cleavage/methylation domain-containing protein